MRRIEHDEIAEELAGWFWDENRGFIYEVDGAFYALSPTTVTYKGIPSTVTSYVRYYPTRSLSSVREDTMDATTFDFLRVFAEFIERSLQLDEDLHEEEKTRKPNLVVLPN